MCEQAQNGGVCCKCDICVFLSPNGGKLATTAEANIEGVGGINILRKFRYLLPL